MVTKKDAKKVPKQKRSPQQVRIIGGKYKGRKLRFVGGRDLRPTLGRTRETLFNWLRGELEGAACLDLFAGSGVLGFEALSQGAAHVTFVERDGRTVRALQDNAAALSATDHCTIVRGDALRYLSSGDRAYDVVFLDPPFASPDLLTNALAILGELAPAPRLVYAEAPMQTDLESLATAHGWRPIKSTRTGDARGMLLERTVKPIAGADSQR